MTPLVVPYVAGSDIENHWHVDQRKLLVMRLLAYGLDIDRLLYVRAARGQLVREEWSAKP